METAAVRSSCHLATEAFNITGVAAEPSTVSDEADRQAATSNAHPRPANKVTAAVLDTLGQVFKRGHRHQPPDLRQPVQV